MLVALHRLAGHPEKLFRPICHVHPVQVSHRVVENFLDQGTIIPMDHRKSIRHTAPTVLLRKAWALDPVTDNGLEFGEDLRQAIHVEVALMRRARDHHWWRSLRQNLDELL